MTAPAVARPSSRVACPSFEPASEMAVTLVVNDRKFPAIARGMHDEKCSAGPTCSRRDGHSLDSLEAPVRKMLGSMVTAYARQDI